MLRKTTYKKKRLLSAILATTLIFNLFTWVSAIVPDQNTLLSEWENTATLSLNGWDADTAFSTVSGELTKYSQSMMTGLQASSTPDIGKVLSDYGLFAINLNWVCSNIYYSGGGQSSPTTTASPSPNATSSPQPQSTTAPSANGYSVYTIFGLPPKADGTSPTDSVKATELIDSWGAMATALSDSGLLSTSNDVVNGTIDMSPILNSAQLSSSTLLSEGDIAGETQAIELAANILRYYCDAGILLTLYKECSGELGSVMTLDQLSSGIDNLYGFDPISSLSDTDFQDLVKKYKSELMPYLNVYKDIYVGYTNSLNNCLAPFEYDTYGQLTTMRKVYTDTLTQNISKTTQTIYNYFFDTSGITNPNGSTGVGQIDTSGGVLSLISNARLSNGSVIVDGDPALTDIGFVILAAGAVYDPFSSIAGEEGYMETINSFLTTDEQKEDVKEILQTALNMKKPLYVTDGSRSSWAESDDLESIDIADYRLAFLSDLLQITEEKTRAYAVIKGQMSSSNVDSSSWVYSNQSTAGQTSSSITVSDPNATGQTASGTSSVYSSSTIGSASITASGEQMTAPIMISSGRAETIAPWNTMSSGFAASVGGLTSMIVHNAAVDAKDNKHLASADREMLFLNGLGDIVLSDGTIVLPAIANPLLYYYGDDYSGKTDEEYIELFSSSTADYQGYYPYTAAFMNHYPVAHISTEGELSITADSDIDKFVLLVEESRLYCKRIKSIGEDNIATLTQTGGVLSAPIYGCSFRATSNPDEAYSILNIGLGSQGLEWQNMVIGWIPYHKYSIDERSFSLMITKGSALNGDGISFYPAIYNDDLSSYISVSAPLTTSAMRFISTSNAGTGSMQSTDKFRVDHYIVSLVAEGLMGTQYADTMIKNLQISYDELVADQGNRFLSFMTQIADSAISTLGTIDGVLGIKGPYDNVFFNLIVGFVQQFYLLIAVALLIIVAAKFIRGHYNIIYVTFIGILCIAGFEVYANWMPVFIPQVYNFVVNDTLENVAWSTVAYKSEAYSDTYRDSDKKDPTSGALKPYTATITLYQMTNAEIEIVAGRTGVDIEELKSGQAVYLDSNAGIFVQGNQIKMSLDKLWVNNSMRGLYQSQWDTIASDVRNSSYFIEPVTTTTNTNPYTIQLTNPYVSLESYYMPYNQIERAFMTNLNTFSSIFRIQRNTYSYDNGEFYKDAFLVSTFVRSGIFTAPGDDEVLRENIVVDSVTGNLSATPEDIIALCNEHFYPQDDWLNLRSVFRDMGPEARASLWGNRMYEKGWYKLDTTKTDGSWVMTEKGEDEITDLILYINNHTKEFVIKELQQIKFCSDENAIKIISLYATTCFTGRLSDIGYWLYPNYINASDIELSDVLYGSMTTVEDKNFAYDGTITNTVAANLGVFGVIFVLLIAIFSAIFIFVITYLIPLLYCAFGGIFIYKLINNKEGVALVKGYAKVTLSTAILYIIYSLGIQLVKIGGYNWYGYLGCLIIIFLCCYFLFWVCLSVVQDFDNLGNSVIASNLLKGLNSITRGAAMKLYSQAVHFQNNVRFVANPSGAAGYGRHYNIDERDYVYARRSNPYTAYSRNVYDDSEYYGYQNYQNTYGPRRPFRFFRNRSRDDMT